MSKPVLALSLAVLAASSALAAEPQIAGTADLPGIQIIGSRSQAILNNLPFSPETLGREQMDQSNASSVEEMLAEMPGSHLDLSPRLGGVSSVYLRAGDPNFALTLINGVKVNDPTNSRGGSYDYASIDPSSLSKIEVVKGGQSALYGSDALGGAINLVTLDDSAANHGSLRAEIGTDGLRQASARMEGMAGSAKTSFTANYYDAGNPVEGSSLVARRYTAGVLAPVSETSSLRIFALASSVDKTSFPEDSGGALYAVLRDADVRDIQDEAFGLTYVSAPNDQVRFQLDASLYQRDETVASQGVAPGARDPFGLPPTSSDNSLQRANYSAYADIELTNTLSWVVGASYEQEDNESLNAIVFPWATVEDTFILDRDTLSLFTEWDGKATERLSWQFGLRYDDVDGIDSEITALAGLSYRLPDDRSRLLLNYGEGFKTPSVFGLGHPLVGNPDLLPEYSKSYEAGYETSDLEGLNTFKAVVFYQEYENLVGFDNGPPPRVINEGNVTSTGAELSFARKLADAFKVSSHLSYADSNILGTQKELRSRPDWRGAVRLNWTPTETFSATIQQTYVGARHDSSIPTDDVILGHYWSTDIRAFYRVSDSLRLRFAIDNAADSQHEEAVGFQNPGRQFRLAADWRFR